MITKLKPFFAFAFASALTLSMFGCAKPAKDEKFQLDPELKKKLDTLTDDDELLGGELKNKTIKWIYRIHLYVCSFLHQISWTVRIHLSDRPCPL